MSVDSLRREPERRAEVAGTLAVMALTMLLATACSQSIAAGPSPTRVAPASPLPSQVAPPAASASPAPSPAPPAPSPTSQVWITIAASDYGYLQASTVSGASCTAKAELPDGSSVGGLEGQRAAGGDGVVRWSYAPAATRATGNGIHSITCSLKGQSATVSAGFGIGS